MKIELIAEVSILENKLIVKPEKESFEQIYRSAMEVNWNEEKKVLYSPVPRDWSYINWFKQIISAVQQEYGCTLKTAENTRWFNIPGELKTEIEECCKKTTA